MSELAFDDRWFENQIEEELDRMEKQDELYYMAVYGPLPYTESEKAIEKILLELHRQEFSTMDDKIILRRHYKCASGDHLGCLPDECLRAGTVDNPLVDPALVVQQTPQLITDIFGWDRYDDDTPIFEEAWNSYLRDQFARVNINSLGRKSLCLYVFVFTGKDISESVQYADYEYMRSIARDVQRDVIGYIVETI